MKYHALFVIFEKQQNLKMLSAAKCRWRFNPQLTLCMLGNFACFLLTEELFVKLIFNKNKSGINSFDPDQGQPLLGLTCIQTVYKCY